MSDSQLILMILPLIILQFTLMLIALIHILRHDHYKTGNRLIWILIVVFLNLLGPILYFTIGRGE